MDPFIAQVIMFGGNFAPRQWSFCEGQLLDIASHTALFSLVGVSYGGDGRSNFRLPDLRGRVAIHPGQGAGLPHYGLGQSGGVPEVTLNVLEIPSHTHAANTSTTVQTNVEIQAADVDGGGRGISGGALAKTPSGETVYSTDTAPDTALNAGTATATATANSSTELQNTGGNLPHANMQPYLAINYIIALEGIYPSRT